MFVQGVKLLFSEPIRESGQFLQANGLAAQAHTCFQVFARACSERELVQARGAGAVEGHQLHYQSQDPTGQVSYRAKRASSYGDDLLDLF